MSRAHLAIVVLLGILASSIIIAQPPSLADALLTNDASFVVWESNRTGAWRIWTRSFSDRTPRQQTRDESTRQHCCPHLSPDGRLLAYLSLPQGQENYPNVGARGILYILNRETGDLRRLATARTYFEHRAVVWRDDRELIFIDEQGRSALYDLATDRQRLLTRQAVGPRGWLIDPTLRHATSGSPSFSPYDARKAAISPLPILGGCQPYFSQDGHWGYWIAAAGGPLYRTPLDARRSAKRSEIWLEKNDSRLPAGQGYFYFPMLSRDQTLLALAASRDEHDHHQGNYDVFVLAVDPTTLRLLGPAQRLTDHPASDRYPDVHAVPARHRREPSEVRTDRTDKSDDSPLLLWRAKPKGGSGFDPTGQAMIAEDGSMVLRGGHFLADMPTMEGLLKGAFAKNVLSLELWLTPGETRAERSTIFTFSSGERSRNFTLAQRGRTLLLRLRTPTSGQNADQPEIDLGELPEGRNHLLISYRPGWLVYYLNGEKQLESNALQGGFFHWKPLPLLLGNEWQSAQSWRGKIHALAFYSRFIEANEARKRFHKGSFGIKR